MQGMRPFLLSALLAAACPILAQPSGEAAAFVPQPGRYSYNIRWQHMTVGKARVTVALTNQTYIITTQAETDNAARHLLRASYRGTARIGLDLRPIDTMETRRIRDRIVVTHSAFSTTGTVTVTRLTTRPGRRLKRKEKVLAGVEQAVDPFSAILAARAMPWSRGVTNHLQLVVGLDRYALMLVCVGEGTVEVEKKRLRAWRLQPYLRKTMEEGVTLDEEDREEQDDTIRAVSGSRVYMAQSPDHDLLRLVSDTNLGSFDVILTSFRPAK